MNIKAIYKPFSAPGSFFLLCAAFSLLSLALSSCFTGVERTDKIKLSREDRRILKPTPEETLLEYIVPSPLGDWQKGKVFYAADNKTLMIFDQQDVVSFSSNSDFAGTPLEFQGLSSQTAPDGSQTAVIVLSDGSSLYHLDTGMDPQKAASDYLSNNSPLLIDNDMVAKTRDLLKNRQVWTRTHFYYDENGQRVSDEKFIPVTIEDVTPGDLLFPLKLRVKTADGKLRYIMMNYGNSTSESRSFAKLFSLSDIRNNYPQIEDNVWALICKGRVAPGMTKEECKLALGNPADVSSGHDYSQVYDIWHYSEGTYLRFIDGRLYDFHK